MLVCSLAASVAYALETDKLEQVVKEKTAEIKTSYPSNFSKEEGVLMLSIKTEEIRNIEDIDMSGETAFFTKSYSYRCPAVKVYNNWLLASASCVHATRGAYKHFTLDGYEIDASQIIGLEDYSSSVVAIFVPHKENSRLVHTLSAMPQANIMILSDTATAQDITNLNNFYINRQRLSGIGRTTAEVKPDLQCEQDKCVLTLENKFINGDYGDPLFSVSENGQEFLLGFNVSNQGFSGRSGCQYALFTDKDLQAIQKAISTTTPRFWPEIKRKIVDEKFLASH